MLSILIPVYNYNVFKLVYELKQQADNLGIEYEILAQDDFSQKFINENNQINTLENCSFSINAENLGRGRNINLLCSKSKYNFILIMEADALPENEFYLKNYIELLSNSTSVIFGGVKYPDIAPSKEKLLRWKYGLKRETKFLNQRLKNNYDFVFTWNLLLKKEILLQFPFPEFIKDYGYEDLIFIENLRLNSVPVLHIQNPLIHYNNEDNIDFIEKSEKAVQNLYNLVRFHKIDPKSTRLTKVHSLLNKLYLTGIIKAIYSITKKRIVANLTSENPNLYLLDFYKLGFYCDLKK
ncbi:glycosyltransferase [Flavobacterium sp. SH_e]|uniref:glycosyltransferase n=1 Tax=Flavobacterium sp. SH_e TaxID=2983767 RepID=UPI0021E35C52|nr:glycosyltransferase [Flavobacterium sp. SH_e]MCV2487278.1 glycosyltransferase [Flavobacterium sp. SH_e]